MLQKSTKSAFIMSGIASFSMTLTFLFWEFLRSRSKIELLAGSVSLYQMVASVFIVTILLLVVLVLPGAFIIHNWSDIHFGREGAVRWGIFGIVCGCLGQLRILIPEDALERGFLSFLIQKGLGIGLGLAIVCVSYFFVFKLLKRDIGCKS